MTIVQAAIDTANPAFAPTDRSSPPTVIASVTPRPAMPIGAMYFSIPTMFSGVANAGWVTAKNAMSST